MAKDGGPAFPFVVDEESDSGYHANLAHLGMSLRDWFAGQALATYLDASKDTPESTLAKLCYEMADAMLAEREKRQ